MAKAKWVGDDLWRLVHLTIAELQVLYPAEQKNTLKGKKAYWKKQILEGKTNMPPSPESQPNPERETYSEEIIDGNLVSSIDGWYEMMHKNEEGEAVVTRLYKHSTKTRPLPEDAAETYTQATPARITPSRRKVPTRDHKRLFVFSDAQIDYRRLPSGELEPIHDERALRVARLLCRDFQPDEIIDLSDTVDLSSLSRFKPDSDHFHRTIGPAFQRAHDMYAEFRSDNPQARIIAVDSNHTTRLKDYMLKNAPQMYGIRRPGAPEEEYPMFTYPYMANLGHIGVEWISGYGAAEYVYGTEYENKPPIVFKHGTTVASNASTASKESKENPETHIVRGHGHRVEQHSRTNRAGQYLVSIMIGSMCRTTGEVPSYHSAVDDKGAVVKYQENWQQSVLLVTDHEGEYQFEHIYIREGLAYHNGKLYSSEE